MKICHVRSVVLTMAMGLMSVSCTKNDSKIKEDSHATNDKINDCLGISVPAPASAVFIACGQYDLGNSANFRYAGPWDEVVQFFSSNLNKDEWTLTSQTYDTRDEDTSSSLHGEWKAEGKNVTLGVVLQNSRIDESAGSIVGIITVLTD